MMKKIENSIFKRTKRRVAMVVALILALSALSVPGAVKEIRAAEGDIYIKNVKGTIVSANQYGKDFSISLNKGDSSVDSGVSKFAGNPNVEVKLTEIIVTDGSKNETITSIGDDGSFSGINFSGKVTASIDSSSSGTNYFVKIETKDMKPNEYTYELGDNTFPQNVGSIDVASTDSISKNLADKYKSIKIKVKKLKNGVDTKEVEEWDAPIVWSATRPSGSSPYIWNGSIFSPVKNENGGVVEWSGGPKAVNATVNVFDPSALVKLEYYVTGTIESGTNVVKSLSYRVLNGSGAQIDSGSAKLNRDKDAGEYSFEISKTYSKSVNILDDYSLELTKITIGDGTIVLGGDEYTIEAIPVFDNGVWKLIITNEIPSIDLPILPSQYENTVKCSSSDGFVTDDNHKRLNGEGGVISTSSLSLANVRSILDYAYLHGNEAFQYRIDEIISDGTQELSLALVATDKSSSDHKDSLKEKARSFDNADNADLKEYFDLSLYVTVDDVIQDDLQITEAGREISFSYTVPNGARLSSASSSVRSRYFNLVRYHKGAQKAGIDEYKNSTSLSPKVSEFSDFALAYYDKSSSSSSRSSSYYNGSSTYRGSSGSGSSPVSDTIDKSGAPKTGDDFDARKWVFILVIGVVVALCSLILYQDTKDWREDRKQ